MTVVDLACGTGMVTEQLSWALCGTGTLIAVDSSAALLPEASVDEGGPGYMEKSLTMNGFPRI